MQLSNLPKWKTSTTKWIEKFANINEKIVANLNRKTPESMAKGRTYLILKDKKKENEASNFAPSYDVLAEQVYGYIIREKLLPDEQKGCRM